MSVPAASVTSEIGRLREAIVHRPGRELRRLTPANKDAFLFDELVWVSEAQAEHDGFVALLRAEGVQVHLFEQLLAEALDDDAVRAALIKEVATADTCGVELMARVRDHVAALSPAQLAGTLIGGLTVAEVPRAAEGFVGGVLGKGAFLLPPLPNTVFTRDPSAWIGDGLVLSPMHKVARRAERRLWRTVYRHHPRFTAASPRTWYGETEDPAAATIEGGDILVLSPRCVAIGLSERSTPVAAENLAARLFAADAVDWVLAVDLPKSRGTMHLDTVLTVVDVDAVVVWPPARSLSAYRIRPGRDRMQVRPEHHLLRGLADGLGADDLRVVTTGEDELTADREQWDDGNNTLALRPGVVVAYQRNVDTNRRLREAGITVHEIRSYELPRGRGGPRCMSCPIRRGPVVSPTTAGEGC